MPLIIGEERLIPGFEANLVGLEVGGTKGFDITFPADYMEESLAGKEAHFEVELRELREKVLPDLDDDFAQSMGDFEDLAELRSAIKERLERNALDGPATSSPTGSSTTRSPTRRSTCPTCSIDQEVEVMHDEFRGSLARQGIAEEAYLKVTEQDRRRPPRRLPARRREAGQGPARALEGRRGRGRDGRRRRRRRRGRARPASATPATRSSSATSTRSAAGTSSARRSAAAEPSSSSSTQWLAAHPDHPALPHVEDGPSGALDSDAAAASAAIDATDPGSIIEHEDGSHSHVHDHDHSHESEPASAG